MALVELAVRLCAQKALKGSTMAEDRVFDSTIGPFNLTDPEKSKPLIIVSIADGVLETTGGYDFTTIGGKSKTEIVIDLMISKPVVVPAQVDGEPDTVELPIPATDAGFEMSLDIMERQMMRALMDRSNPWADHFALFAGFGNISVQKQRGAGNSNGVKFAMRQLIIGAPLGQEPPFGQAPAAGTWWESLFALMDADPDLNDTAKIMRAAYIGEPLNDVDALRVSMGWGPNTTADLGLGPSTADTSAGQFEPADPDLPVIFEEPANVDLLPEV